MPRSGLSNEDYSTCPAGVRIWDICPVCAMHLLSVARAEAPMDGPGPDDRPYPPSESLNRHRRGPEPLLKDPWPGVMASVLPT